MSHLRRSLLFYLGLLGFFLLTVICFTGNITKVLVEPLAWLFPAAFVLFGQFLGWILYELNLRLPQKKNKMFLAGHWTGAVVFVTLVAFLTYMGQREDRLSAKRANREWIENNRLMREDEKYLEIAFNRLESEFERPDDFRLNSYFVRSRDTVVNGIPDTIHKVFFTYYVRDDMRTWLSKIEVFQKTAALLSHKFDYRLVQEYLVEKHESDAEVRAVLDTVREVINRLPDTSAHKQLLREVVEDFLEKN